MKLLRYFCFVSMLVALSTLHAASQAVTPQPALKPSTSKSDSAQIAKMPVVALPIKDFKLISSGTGWVSTGSQLLFTTDNGAHWKDISPPNPNSDSYASVFFHDADTGWVLLVGHPRDGECADEDRSESDWAFHIASTVDGGKNWMEAHVKMPSCATGVAGPSLNDNGNITFADKLHGWLLLEHQSGSAFSFGSLFTTSDGGRTWYEVKGPGFYGDIRAYSNSEIWVAGDPGANDEGKAQELVVSLDGGNHFEEVSLDAPKEIAPADDPTYGLPIFEDNLHGYEPVTYSGGNGDKSAEVLFATSDGGHTWKPDRILSNLDERSVGGLTFSTVVGSVWLHAFAPTGTPTTLLKLHSRESKKAAINERGRDDFNNCELSFVTVDDGWMNCSGNLTSTIDGGASSIPI